MNEPKRHHVVPEFYLKRFGQNGRIELLDRTDLGRSITTTVDNALVEKHFYSIETHDGRDTSVERMFASHVEGPASRAIGRVVDQGKPVSMLGLRRAISTFLAFQYVRGAATRYAQVEFFKATTQKIATLATPDMIRAHFLRQGEMMTQEEAEDLVDFARHGDYRIGVSSEANLHLGMLLQTALELVPLFEKRRWILLNFPSAMLITSDEPIALVGRTHSPGEVKVSSRHAKSCFQRILPTLWCSCVLTLLTANSVFGAPWLWPLSSIAMSLSTPTDLSSVVREPIL
jgi:hypothetical protein